MHMWNRWVLCFLGSLLFIKINNWGTNPHHPDNVKRIFLKTTLNFPISQHVWVLLEKKCVLKSIHVRFYLKKLCSSVWTCASFTWKQMFKWLCVWIINISVDIYCIEVFLVRSGTKWVETFLTGVGSSKRVCNKLILWAFTILWTQVWLTMLYMFFAFIHIFWESSILLTVFLASIYILKNKLRV